MLRVAATTSLRSSSRLVPAQTSVIRQRFHQLHRTPATPSSSWSWSRSWSWRTVAPPSTASCYDGRRWASTNATSSVEGSVASDGLSSIASSSTTATTASSIVTGGSGGPDLSNAVMIGSEGIPHKLNPLAQALCSRPSSPQEIWYPAEVMRDIIVAIHDMMPSIGYWTIIPVTAVIWRALSLPVQIDQIRIINTLPRLYDIHERVFKYVLNNLPQLNQPQAAPLRASIARSIQSALVKEYKCQQWRLLLPPFAVQLPMFVLFTMAVRRYVIMSIPLRFTLISTSRVSHVMSY
jgi:hypothetical protein